MNEPSSGLSRRTSKKAAGAAGAVAAVGTTQVAADEGIVVPQLENTPAELAISLVIPHRRVGLDVDGGYHTASR